MWWVYWGSNKKLFSSYLIPNTHLIGIIHLYKLLKRSELWHFSILVSLKSLKDSFT